MLHPELYRLAREVTDEIFGPGAYAESNENHPDPQIRKQAAISKALANQNQNQNKEK